MATKNDIKEFIENFKNQLGDGASQIIQSFFAGNCNYWFIRILAYRFPQGEILYDTEKNYFLFYGGSTMNIKGNGIFDITGEVTDIYLPLLLDGKIIEWNLYANANKRKQIWKDKIAFLKEEDEIAFLKAEDDSLDFTMS